MQKTLLGPQGDVGQWVETEFSYELMFCRAIPYMQEVYRKVQELGKPIIIVSDMYWPKEYLEKLLNKTGYDGWEEIFVSCEQNATKGPGLLQETAWATIGKQNSVIHVGDHYENDVRGSILMGWDANN